MKTSLQKICLSVLVSVVIFVDARSQNVTVYDSFPQLESRLKTLGDTTLLLNFWATWCKPCVQELPYFQALEKKYTGKKIKILLVSLDFKTQLDSLVIPFVKNKNVRQEVVLLADTDENTWISKVANEWDGAIPVTLLISGNKRLFHGEAFESEAMLEKWVESAY
jgi:thiol-disulfide isomerase/thioredoxin